MGAGGAPAVRVRAPPEARRTLWSTPSSAPRPSTTSSAAWAPGAGTPSWSTFKYPANAPDLNNEAIRLIRSGADAYLFASYVSDAILFMRTLKLRGASPRLIWGQNAGFTNPDFVKGIGKDLHGLTFPPWLRQGKLKLCSAYLLLPRIWFLSLSR